MVSRNRIVALALGLLFLAGCRDNPELTAPRNLPRPKFALIYSSFSTVYNTTTGVIHIHFLTEKKEDVVHVKFHCGLEPLTSSGLPTQGGNCPLGVPGEQNNTSGSTINDIDVNIGLGGIGDLWVCVADQTGNARWICNRVTSINLPQTISFGPLPDKYLDAADSTVTASATSGLTVTFTSNTPATCSVTSGGLVHPLAVGTCTLVAHQAGGLNGPNTYLAAPDVLASFQIITRPSTATATDVSGPYNGQPFNGVGTCSNSITPLLTYSGGIAPSDAGTSTFIVTCAANGYTTSADTGTITIAKANVVATAGSGSKTYDGAVGTPSNCAVTPAVTGGFTGDLSCTNDPASAGPGAGTTAISPIVAGTGQSNFSITSNSGSFSITAALGAANANPGGGVYTGSAYTGTGSCLSGGTPTITYAGGSAPISVGTTSFTVTCAATTNFGAASENGTITITKAPSTTTVTCPATVPFSRDLAGNPVAQTPCSASVTGAGGLNQVLSVLYSNNVHVGQATASASFGGDANHLGSSDLENFDVLKGSNQEKSGTIDFTPVNKTWGASDFTLAPVLAQALTMCSQSPVTGYNSTDFACDGGASASQALHWFADGSCTIDDNGLVHPTSAGDCQVTLTRDGFAVSSPDGDGDTWTFNAAAGSESGNSSEATHTLHILPAQVTATAGSGSHVYNGSNGTPSACAVTGDPFPGTATCSNSPATVGPNAGTYTVSPVGSASVPGNYTFTPVNGSYSIGKASSTASANNGGGVFTGSSYSGSGTCSNGAAPGITYVGGSAPINAGTTGFTVTCPATANYDGATTTGSITITPALVTATGGSGSKVFNGSTGTPTPCSVTGSFGLTCTNSPDAPGPNVGTYPIAPQISAGPNFIVAVVDGSFSITKAASSATNNDNGGTYNGNTFPGGGTCSNGATPVITYAGGSTTPPTDAGTYSFTVTCPATDNYDGSSTTGTIKIDPAAVTATAGGGTKVFDGLTGTPSACSVSGGFGLNCTNSPTAAGPNVGSYTIAPVISAGPNYTVTPANGTFTVTKAPTVTTVTCPATAVFSRDVTTGDPIAQTPCSATVAGAGGLSQSLTVSYINNLHVGQATASASYAGSSNYEPSSDTENFDILKGSNQEKSSTIDFTPVNKTWGAADFTLATVLQKPLNYCSGSPLAGYLSTDFTCDGGATASTVLHWFAAPDGACSIDPDNGTVHILSAGDCTITLTRDGFSVSSPDGDGDSWSFNAAAGSESTNQAEATHTIHVGPATVTATAGSGSHTFNGLAGTPSACAVTGDPFPGTASCTNNLTSVGPNAGSYTISPIGAAPVLSNYTFTPVAGTYTINKAAVTATAGNGSKTYDGLTGTPSSCVLSGAFTTGLLCTNNPTAAGPGAGTYPIAPNVSGGEGNFTVTPANGSYTVGKANLVVTAASYTINLGETVPNCSLSGNFVNGETMSVLTPGSCSKPNPTQAGTYSYVPSGYSSPNYNISYVNGTLTVNAPFMGVIGWLEPIAPTMPDRARVRSGSTIPAKFKIVGNNGQTYQDPGAKLTVFFCGATMPASVADCGTPVPGFVNLPMRADGSMHIYNVNTDKNWKGFYRFVGTLSPSFGLPDITGQSKTTLLGYIEITPSGK